jgi:isopentenyl diphosphate isomerase/L-lactate dehydrogenase-like FMN-dependent dehydrogenase
VAILSDLIERAVDRLLMLGLLSLIAPISILADEIKITLKLMGLNSIKELQAKGAECVYQIA